ncbi:MAG: BamA/TamA family outer membrane protein [Deltaproteobacteria bacterium]|nr:BamA/TamA family outer membrane protein [Deltaproteobacteria bacterium]
MAHAHVAARALAFILIFSACGHSPPPRHPGEEYLAAIEFEGNKAIKSKDLRTGLALHRVQSQGSAPDPYLVTVDADRLKGQYLRAGFLEVDVHSRVERHGDAVTVIYKIDEGPRAITKLEISGLPPNDPQITENKVRNFIPLKDGDPFTYDPYDKAKEPMLGVAEDAGYAHAKLNAKVVVDRVNHQAIVQLTYDLGPKCHFGKIVIQGVQDSDLRDSVRARLEFNEGDEYSAKAIEKSQTNLYALKRFSTVRILPDKSDGDTVDIHVSLSPASAHELSLGGGFGIDPATYEVRGRVGYSQIGWPLPLYRFDFDGRPAYAVLRDGSGYEPRVRAIATLTRMDLFAPYVNGVVEGGFDYMVLETWTEFGPRGKLAMNSPLWTDHFKGEVGWEIQQFQFSHVNTLIDPTLEHMLMLDQTERNGAFEQSLKLDYRDNPVEPHLGVYSELRVAEGGPYAAGALTYTEVVPEVRGYVPVPNSGVVIAARARYGAIFGQVPVSERFFGGGSSSNRGFSERRLSPTVAGMTSLGYLTEPIGGGAMFDSSLELRSQLTEIRKIGIGGVAFLDAGDVTMTPADLNLGHLNYALGAGLRAFTVVGAVRFDFGYRLNRTGPMDPEPGSHYAFHLSLGEAF